MPLYIRPERRRGAVGDGDGDVEGGSPHKQPSGGRERLSSTQVRLLLGLYAGYSSMMFSRASKSQLFLVI